MKAPVNVFLLFPRFASSPNSVLYPGAVCSNTNKYAAHL